MACCEESNRAHPPADLGHPAVIGQRPDDRRLGQGDPETPFVYALGRVEPRFPTLDVEKEFAQATGRSGTSGITDQQILQSVLRDNRYLARRMCWVFRVGGIETYLIMVRDVADMDLLLDSLRSAPRPTDIDVIVGVRGPVAPPAACNGLSVPVVAIDQLYHLDIDTLVSEIPRAADSDAERFALTAEELFWRVQQIADNTGAANEHRALNYLAVRYPGIYTQTAQLQERNYSLSGVDVKPSTSGGARTIVNVLFTYTHRQTGMQESYSMAVDVSGVFPFLVRPLSPSFGSIVS